MSSIRVLCIQRKCIAIVANSRQHQLNRFFPDITSGTCRIIAQFFTSCICFQAAKVVVNRNADGRVLCQSRLPKQFSRLIIIFGCQRGTCFIEQNRRILGGYFTGFSERLFGFRKFTTAKLLKTITDFCHGCIRSVGTGQCRQQHQCHNSDVRKTTHAVNSRLLIERRRYPGMHKSSSSSRNPGMANT